LCGTASRVFGLFAPILAVYSPAANTPNGPVYTSAALFVITGLIMLALPIETRGRDAYVQTFPFVDVFPTDTIAGSQALNELFIRLCFRYTSLTCLSLSLSSFRTPFSGFVSHSTLSSPPHHIVPIVGVFSR
jgi:hypothetical protein